MPTYKTDTPTKDGRKYFFYLSWTDPNGERRQYKSKKFKLLSDCQKAEAQFRLSQNKTIAERFTFDEMIDEYIAQKEKQGAKPSTMNNTRNCLAHTRKVLGKVRIDKLNNRQWESFLSYLEEQPMKNHRRNRIIEYSVAVCNYANKKHGVFTSVPSRFEKFNEQADKPLDDKMEFWTPEQFSTFLSVVDDPLYHTLFLLLFTTGMRSGECLALQWKDIDFDARTVSISKTVNTKLKGQQFVLLPPKTRTSNRTIRLTQTACDGLSALYGQVVGYEQFTPEWFVFGSDRPIPNSTLQSKKKRYYNKAVAIDPSLPNIRIHSLRHSCASALINSGATITYISKFLGHSSVKETLDTYSHFFPSETDIITDKMDEILKKST